MTPGDRASGSDAPPTKTARMVDGTGVTKRQPANKSSQQVAAGCAEGKLVERVTKAKLKRGRMLKSLRPRRNPVGVLEDSACAHFVCATP